MFTITTTVGRQSPRTLAIQPLRADLQSINLSCEESPGWSYNGLILVPPRVGVPDEWQLPAGDFPGIPAAFVQMWYDGSAFFGQAGWVVGIGEDATNDCLGAGLFDTTTPSNGRPFGTCSTWGTWSGFNQATVTGTVVISAS